MVDFSSISNLMKGKRGVVFGVANNRSLGWAIAEAASLAGAEIAFTYQSDVFLDRVKPLAESIGSNLVLECDVSKENSIKDLFTEIGSRWDKIDFIVHSLAYSDKNELKGAFVNISKENFLNAMHISCYSLIEIAREALPLMKENGSIITLSYYGAEKVMPNYHVMGPVKSALETTVQYMAADLGEYNIRVNAISAGPVRTLASSGIGDFRYILKWNELNAPLKRNTTMQDLGGAGVYLLSDLSCGTTGEVIHVDNGYHVVGMKRADAPDIATVLES